MNNTQPNNPMCWVIMHNLVILGAYSRPEWAAAKVWNTLGEELRLRIDRAERFKHMKPDSFYVLRDGYDPDTGEIDLLHYPTLEQLQEIITERSNSMGVTVAGIASSTYALNIIPVLLDS